MDQSPSNTQTPVSNQDPGTNTEDPNQEKVEEEEEEKRECGFCLFMKGGGCKDQFVAWENCVEEGEKNREDIVEKCFEITSLLKKCMDAHSDYYEPVLGAEKAMLDAENEGEELDKAKEEDLTSKQTDTKSKETDTIGSVLVKGEKALA